MNTITRAALIERLASVNHAMPIGLTCITDARARKTDCPYSRIRKLSIVSAFLAASYERSVNRQLAREDHSQLTFAAKSRSFGEHVGPALIRHINKDGHTHYYIPVHIRHARKPLYLVEEGGMRKIVKKEKVEAFLPPERKEGENQGCENPIVYRNYAVENVVKINLDGERLTVVD